MDPFNNPYILYVLRRDWWITHHSMEFYGHWKQRMNIYNKLANMIKKRSVIK